jgi:hypothetical protein
MLFVNSVAMVFMILLAIDETKDAFRHAAERRSAER